MTPLAEDPRTLLSRHRLIPEWRIDFRSLLSLLSVLGPLLRARFAPMPRSGPAKSGSQGEVSVTLI